MLGGSLGGATIAVVQGIVLLLIAMLFGFRPYNWALLGAHPGGHGNAGFFHGQFQFRNRGNRQRYAGLHGHDQFLVIPSSFFPGRCFPWIMCLR